LQAGKADKKALKLAQAGRMHPEALVKSGRAMLDQGRREEALDLFARYNQYRPGDPEGLFWQAVALDECGRTAESVQIYRAAAQSAEDQDLACAEVWTNLGNVYLKTGKVDEAIDAYLRASSIDPELVPAKLNLARAQIEKGDCLSALESLNRCTDLHYNGPQLSYYRAKAFLKLGRIEEASTHVDKLLMQLPEGPRKADVKREFGYLLNRPGGRN
jgi:tetratricopeptide (TPR) repeat protein